MIIIEYYSCVISFVCKLGYCVILAGDISGGAGSLPYCVILTGDRDGCR